MLVFLAIAMMAVCSNDEDEARAAIAIAQAQAALVHPKIETLKPEPGPVPRKSDYDLAMAQCRSDGIPFVTFVGTPSRKVSGLVSVFAGSLSDGTKNAIIVSTDGRDGRWLKSDATDSQIRQAAGLEQPMRAPPFAPSSSRQGLQTADGNPPWLSVGEQNRLMNLWPKSKPGLSDGMRFYKQTQKSQRIAITDERPSLRWYHVLQHDVYSNAPTDLNPNSVKPHWRVPGGLHNVEGWESYTAAYIPEGGVVETQGRPIVGAGRLLPGYVWSYPDGTIFSDLLVKDGKAFELRIRAKDGSQWDSYVAFRDKTAAPIGYHGVGKKCSECHDSGPGSSEQYGITVRGSDTVFSFNPFD